MQVAEQVLHLRRHCPQRSHPGTVPSARPLFLTARMYDESLWSSMSRISLPLGRS